MDGPGVTNLSAQVDHSYNTWNGIGVTAADFVDIDMETLYEDATASRNADGSRPEIGLELAPNSDLIDAGIDVGLPFHGAAPDLGPFDAIMVSVAELPHGRNDLTVSPNPFSDRTEIRFHAANEDVAKIRIFDVNGMPVQSFSVAVSNSQTVTLKWDGSNDAGNKLKAGIYVVEVRSGKKVMRRKVVNLNI